MCNLPPLPEIEGVEVRHVPGFDGYAVTSDGRAFSCKMSKEKWSELAQTKTKSGYLTVNLSEGNKSNCYRVHRLVLLAFIGTCPTGMQCRHLDGNKVNNCLDNLLWGTCKENHADKRRHGTVKFNVYFGEKHPGSKLTNYQTQEIREMKNNGVPSTVVARKFAISRALVNYIMAGKRRQYDAI